MKKIIITLLILSISGCSNNSRTNEQPTSSWYELKVPCKPIFGWNYDGDNYLICKNGKVFVNVTI